MSELRTKEEGPSSKTSESLLKKEPTVPSEICLSKLPESEIARLRVALKAESDKRKELGKDKDLDSYQAALERLQTCFGSHVRFTEWKLTPRQYRDCCGSSIYRYNEHFVDAARKYAASDPSSVASPKDFYRFVKATGVTIYVQTGLHLPIYESLEPHHNEILQYLKTLSWQDPSISDAITLRPTFVEKHANPKLLPRTAATPLDIKLALSKAESRLTASFRKTLVGFGCVLILLILVEFWYIVLVINQTRSS